MVTTTKFPKGLAIGGRKGGKTDPSGVLAIARASFDPTSATQIPLFTLAAGSIPLWAISYGGATGGTDPTVNIGTDTDEIAFSGNLPADSSVRRQFGTLLNFQLGEDTIVYGKVGSSAATGGEVFISIAYIMEDM